MAESTEVHIFKERFSSFLKHKHLRFTAERFTVLDGVLMMTDRFTTDDLMRTIVEHADIKVSRASVYNTLTLLVECGIVRQISLTARVGYYERSDFGHTTHLICSQCGKIKDIKDKPFVAFMNVRNYSAFTAERYTLCVYGICSACARKKKKPPKPWQ